jgi:hypothetical protein
MSREAVARRRSVRDALSERGVVALLDRGQLVGLWYPQCLREHGSRMTLSQEPAHLRAVGTTATCSTGPLNLSIEVYRLGH